MGWVYSPISVCSVAQEDSTSGLRSSVDLEQSHTANGTRTPKPSSSPECKTEDLTTPLSGTTCQHSTADHSAAALTLFLEAFPVKIFPTPASGKESPDQEVGYGNSMPESWTKYDPDSSSWKTSQACLLTGLSESFWGMWPRWGLMLNGQCFQPQQSEPPIFENESYLLPTPTAHMGQFPMVSWETAENKLKNGQRKSGVKIGSDLCWDLGVNYLLNGYKKFPAWVNPHFCEWMMGWPIGWSFASEELSKSAVTESFRNKLPRPGKKSDASRRIWP